jgi:hypothetical protein
MTSEKGLLDKSELAKVLGAEGATGDELEAAIEDGRKRGAILKCFILRDSATKNVWAHVVPVKGLDEERHILTVICDDLKWLGHTRMIIRCDNEPALKALAEEAILAAKARIESLESLSKEAPEPYDSQSNGLIEVGVRMIRAQFRTLKACLERRLGVELPISHPVMAWLLQHTTLLMNAVPMGYDGLTPWHRARGRAFGTTLVCFGEVCMYKQPPKGPQHDVEGNMAPRWHDGLFLGFDRNSSSYILSTADGIRTARTIQRLPMADRWSVEKLQMVAGTPWTWAKRERPTVTFGKTGEKLEEFPDRLPLPRRFKIIKSFLVHIQPTTFNHSSCFSSTFKQTQFFGHEHYNRSANYLVDSNGARRRIF